jgi:hypothetical protein
MSQASIKAAVAERAQAFLDNPRNAQAVYESSSRWEGDVQCNSMRVDAVESQCPILDTQVRPIRASAKAFLNGQWEYHAKAA